MRVRIIKEIVKKQNCTQADGEKGSYIIRTADGDSCYKSAKDAYGIENKIKNLEEAREEIPKNLTPEESEMLLADVDTKDAMEILKLIYNKINSIRAKKPAVAKHFPKVYDIKNIDSEDYVFVIMELLTSDSSAMQTIYDTFAGMEQAHLNLPIEKIAQLAGQQGMPVGYSEKVKRMYNKIKNIKEWSKIVNDFIFQFNFIYN